MLLRNSSRGRNGHKSSNGFDTNDPSGRCTDEDSGASDFVTDYLYFTNDWSVHFECCTTHLGT